MPVGERCRRQGLARIIAGASVAPDALGLFRRGFSCGYPFCYLLPFSFSPAGLVQDLGTVAFSRNPFESAP
jgi:hypothetical protein